LQGENLKTVAMLTERELQNFFGCEVFVSLEVLVEHKPRPIREIPEIPTLDTHI
jgi:GTPase Era involved in 16S rRNA processing